MLPSAAARDRALPVILNTPSRLLAATSPLLSGEGCEGMLTAECWLAQSPARTIPAAQTAPPELSRGTKAVVYKQPISEISREQAKQRETPITRKVMEHFVYERHL